MRANRALIATAVLLTATAGASPNRSAAARAEFVKANPCPATGKPRGSCPGFVVDHIVPLCAGGRDHHTNMQWQTIEDAKVKDRQERRNCKR